MRTGIGPALGPPAQYCRHASSGGGGKGSTTSSGDGGGKSGGKGKGGGFKLDRNSNSVQASKGRNFEFLSRSSFVERDKVRD